MESPKWDTSNICGIRAATRDDFVLLLERFRGMKPEEMMSDADPQSVKPIYQDTINHMIAFLEKALGS